MRTEFISPFHFAIYLGCISMSLHSDEQLLNEAMFKFECNKSRMRYTVKFQFFEKNKKNFEPGNTNSQTKIKESIDLF